MRNVSIVLALGLIAALTAAVVESCGGGSTAGSTGAPGGPCKNTADCTGGQACNNQVCTTLCSHDTDCKPAESCVDQMCTVTQTQCTASTACVTPAACETSVGAVCQGGACHYQPLDCEQPSPVNPCRARTGRCDVGSSGCSGAGCCIFDPAWPTGSSDSQPACPFSGEDPNGNGTKDVGETWSGVCDHNGGCSGCTSSTQCADDNSCTIDSCNGLGACEYDTTARAGLACTVTTTDDGLCTVIGAGRIACRLKDGAACAGNEDCANGNCVGSVCCHTACTGGCGTCSTGTCHGNDAGCTGTCPGTCTATSATEFNCVGDDTKCIGNCDHCLPTSATQFDCAGDNNDCTGNCDACDKVAGNRFDCAKHQELCTGDCPGACASVSATRFDCTANESACTGTCRTCSLSGATTTCVYVTSGVSDPGSCDSPKVCGVAGACGLPDGVGCTNDSDCLGGHQCECATASCEVVSNRVCAANNCVCKYGAYGACTTNMPNTGTYNVDPLDCVAPSHCYNGGCTGGVPGTCSGTCSGCSLSYTNSCNTGFAPSGGNCFPYGGTMPGCYYTGSCTCVPAP